MKLIIKSIIIVFFIHSNCFSHDNEYVHQRIVVEAYNLLKLQFSMEENGIADINSYLGDITEHDIYYWYSVWTNHSGDCIECPDTDFNPKYDRSTSN